ncbi:SMR domain-containing protein At5g58720 isoform X4 [Cajanus cajan]|uniref:Smr domain-containing protein YPL199C n=1 Tax=Cajanus cajan TaxID=3821 RepID=A0A151UA16_CAJCA|nr:SMR domain-containing protein At5g58720 isoform X4 [Cajanus cajan]KYP76109.1 Smr domain-containing protein YPL199C [Cajanus cajan]
MKNPRKKKRPKPQKKIVEKKGVVVDNGNEEEKTKERVLEALVEAFALSSVKEASIAYDIARGDPNKASEILRKGFVDRSEDSFSCSSSSSCSGGGSMGSELGSKGEGDLGCFKGGRQKKKVVASTGTVSTVLGKEYVRRDNVRDKGFSGNGGVFDMEEAEQFLCSMLGNDCDLNLAIVRDVFCQCGYDIEKASDVLLDLAASTIEKSGTGRHPNYRVDNIDDERFLVDPNDNLIDRRSESTSLSSDGDLSDNLWPVGSFGRKYVEVLSSSKADSAVSSGYTKSDIPQKASDIPQKVLESLFNIPKSTEHGKDTMNWRNVVKQIQSLGPRFNPSQHVAESQQCTYAKGDEYHVFREDSQQHYDSMKSYYKKAATAYTKGDRAYAAYLSEQGKEQTKLAQKADTRASHDIFVARNKGIENVITIDLHGQHVKQAMRMLKLHLLFGSYVPSVQTLRVITGCGSHGVGMSKLKQSIISLLDREAIEWTEENRGTVLIKLNGCREYSFVENSDSDSND